MNNFLQTWALLIFSLSTLGGCTMPPKVDLHPVANQTPPRPAGVYEAKEVNVIPVPTFQAAPRYPHELKEAGISGAAVVLFTVQRDGSVTDVTVVNATDALFGQSAIEAILKWRFRPAQLNSNSVACRIEFPFEFNISRSAKVSGALAPTHGYSTLQVDTIPVPSHDNLVYRDILRDKGIFGRALVRVDIKADGSVSGVDIIEADNKPLKEALPSLIRQWSFTPAIKNGEPVACFMHFECQTIEKVIH